MSILSFRTAKQGRQISNSIDLRAPPVLQAVRQAMPSRASFILLSLLCSGTLLGVVVLRAEPQQAAAPKLTPEEILEFQTKQ
jgi:putative heme-binding domain-containing protein